MNNLRECYKCKEDCESFMRVTVRDIYADPLNEWQYEVQLWCLRCFAKEMWKLSSGGYES